MLLLFSSNIFCSDTCIGVRISTTATKRRYEILIMYSVVVCGMWFSSHPRTYVFTLRAREYPNHHGSDYLFIRIKRQIYKSSVEWMHCSTFYRVLVPLARFVALGSMCGTPLRTSTVNLNSICTHGIQASHNCLQI